MGPTEALTSTLPALDPIIMDDEMESAFRDANMDFLDPTSLDISSGSAGGDFDDLFAHLSNPRSSAASESSKSYQDQHPLRQPPFLGAESPADSESPNASSNSSSSESPRNRLRQISVASTSSAAHSETPLTSSCFPPEDWMRPELPSVKEESPFTIDPSFTVDGGFSMARDLESSNKAMDAAFDFESAASSPSPMKSENTPQPNSRKLKSPIWSPYNVRAVTASNEPTAASPVSHLNNYRSV